MKTNKSKLEQCCLKDNDNDEESEARMLNY